MKKYNIGDRVRIKRGNRFLNKRFYDKANPPGIDGVITGIIGNPELQHERGILYISVKWDNGRNNIYHDMDIEFSYGNKFSCPKFVFE